MGNRLKKTKGKAEPSKINFNDPSRRSIMESNISSVFDLGKSDGKLSKSEIDLETLKQGYSSPSVYF